MRWAAWVNSRDFLKSRQWKEARYLALCRYGGRCMCCGASAKDGAVLNVDHIRPRHTHPHRALDLDNLQILCRSCNRGNGRVDAADCHEQKGFPKWLIAIFDLRPWVIYGAVGGFAISLIYLALETLN